MHTYTHLQYTLTYVHIGLHISTTIQMHRHTNIYIYIYTNHIHKNSELVIYNRLAWERKRIIINVMALLFVVSKRNVIR